MNTAPSTAEWNALRSAIAGEVVLPGSGDYEAVRKPAMARCWDIRPQVVVAVARPRTSRTRLPLALTSTTTQGESK